MKHGTESRRSRLAAVALLAALTGCGLTDPDPPRRTLDVAAYKAVCAGPFYRFCLQVREPGSTEWEYFYEAPRNFDFEWGLEARIVVEEQEIENPPPDGGTVRRTLVRVVSSSALPADTRFTLLVPAGATAESGAGVHQFNFGSESFSCAAGPDCDGLAAALLGNDAVELTLELGNAPDDPFRVVDWRDCGAPWPSCE